MSGENPMVAVVREELRKKRDYADECEERVRDKQDQVRASQARLEQLATIRDRADKDAEETQLALNALLALNGDDDEQ